MRAVELIKGTLIDHVDAESEVSSHAPVKLTL